MILFFYVEDGTSVPPISACEGKFFRAYPVVKKWVVADFTRFDFGRTESGFPTFLAALAMTFFARISVAFGSGVIAFVAHIASFLFAKNVVI